MSAGPPRQRGKAPSWFQARLVDGEASPLRGSAVSAASSRSSQPGETIVPLSSSTSVSARVAAASRFRQAAAPAGVSVADCGDVAELRQRGSRRLVRPVRQQQQRHAGRRMGLQRGQRRAQTLRLGVHGDADGDLACRRGDLCGQRRRADRGRRAGGVEAAVGPQLLRLDVRLPAARVEIGPARERARRCRRGAGR